MKRQSTSKLLRLMVAVFALFLLVMAGSVLSACGGETVEENPNNNTPAEVHKHTYGPAEHTAIAKCGSTGYDVYTCTVCGDKYAIVTAATGAHDFKNGVCEVCGLQLPKEYTAYDDSQLQELIESNDTALKKYLETELGKINTAVGQVSEAAKAHKHDFEGETAETITIAPTCICRGYTIKKCECGSTAVVSSTDIARHQYAETGNKVAATCTTNGQIEMQCTVCHDTYWALNTADVATGHDFKRSSKDNDRAANCITPELRAYTCTKCGEVSYQEFGEIDEHRHSDSDNAKDLNSWIPETSWTLYVTDGAVPSVPEDGAEPDKVPSNVLKVYYATCPKCGKTAWKYEDVPCQHTWQNVINVVETCETPGEYNDVCTFCGKYANQRPDGDVYDESLVSETQNNVKFEALGHEYDLNNLNSFYEVDRDEHGNIITDDQNGKISANTTCWEGTVCGRCHLNIAVAEGADEDGSDLVLVIDGYKAEAGSNILDFATDRLNERYLKQIIKEVLARNPEVTEEELTKDTKAMELLQSYADVVAPFYAKRLFPREWHAWTLYNPAVDEDGEIIDRTIELDTGVTLVPPEKAEAPVYETCMTFGTYWYYCLDTGCTKHVEGDVHGRWITVDHDPLMHNWQPVEDGDTDPTCTKSGVKMYKCANTLTKTDSEGKTTEWKCEATLKVSIDATQEEEITKPEHFWEAKYRTQDEDGNNVWDPDYLKLWAKKGVLKLEPTAATGAPAESVGTADEIFAQLTPEQIEEFAKAVMPQAHLWEKDTVATDALGKHTCFDGNATIYKCVCKMNDGECCSDAESGKCPTWKATSEPAHLTNEDDENEFGTFIIYGKDYSERGERFNIEVTYCKFCGLEISRKVLTDRNYKHFPFDRAKIAALLETHVPAYTEEEIDGVIVRTYTNPEEFMSEEAIAARKEYANVWIAIQKYWFEDSMDEKYEADLFDYLYTKGNPKNDSKFTIFCNDCFNAEFDFVVSEDHACAGFTFTDSPTRVIYAYDPKTNEYIKITDDTAQTYNSCEYVYYEQYEKECDTCKTTFRYATQDGKGYNRYTRLTKTTDGEYVTLTGTHYLVPMEKYWERESYQVNEDGTVTLDWICELCGQIVERTVKYAVPETESEVAPTAEDPAEPEKVFTDVNADEHYVLLVNLEGIVCDTELNDRTGGDAETVFQKDDVIYFGKDCSEDGKTIEYRVGMTYVLKEENGKLASFVKGSDKNAKRIKSRKASYVRASEFIDTESKEGKEEYEALWAERYGKEADEDGTRIKALFAEGGEIVLGDDVKLDEGLAIKTETELDLGGHALEAKVSLNKKNANLTIENGDVKGGISTTEHGNVTVKNATIRNDSGAAILFAPNGSGSSQTQANTDSVITLENVVIYAKKTAVVANGLADGGKLVMNNCTIINDEKNDSIALWIAGDTTVEAKNCVFYNQWQAVHVNSGNSTFTDCTFIAGKHSDNESSGESVWKSGGANTPKEAEAVFVIAAKGGGYGKTAKVTLNGACAFKLAKDDTLTEKTTTSTNVTGKEQIGESDWYYTPNETTSPSNTKKLISVNVVNDGTATLALDDTTAKTLGITAETAKNVCGAWNNPSTQNAITIIISGTETKVANGEAVLKHEGE